MNTTTSSMSREALPGTRQTTDDMLQTPGKAVDSTRDYARQALDKVEDKGNEFRSTVDPLVDMLASKAQKLARQSLDIAADAKDKAQQSLSRYASVTTHYVAEQPLRSVLMAAAVGAAVALLVTSVRNRHFR